MSDRVKALEQDVTKLDEGEFKRFAAWFANYQQRLWEKQIERDVKAGRLDFLLEEAREGREKGTLRDI